MTAITLLHGRGWTRQPAEVLSIYITNPINRSALHSAERFSVFSWSKSTPIQQVKESLSHCTSLHLISLTQCSSTSTTGKQTPP